LEFRTVEHTADIGIEVEADSLEELFEGAAAGMFSIVVDPGTVEADISREITLEAADLGELMFTWLNELLFLLYTGALLPSRFEVKNVDGSGLEAMVSGETPDPGRHRMLEEIKAATYHQMTVSERGQGWFARVIFDV
jgi:SHS2 domain-containing protein